MTNLSGSVGALGANLMADVLAVQKLINLCIGLIVPRARVVENGISDGSLIAAIKDFQSRVVHSAFPDGRVDPGGQTVTALDICAAGLPYPPVTPRPPIKYTSNPNEVPTQTTTPSALDVVNMLLHVWTALNQNGARTLTAQFMAETGEGRFCFNWNLGNVKAAATDPHMYLHN